MIMLIYPLHHIAHCLSNQTSLLAFKSVCLSKPEGDDTGTLQITRRDDVEMGKSFEVTAEAHRDVI